MKVHTFLKKGVQKLKGRKMNDLENYKNLIENIFGDNTTSFQTSSNKTNKIIGALNHSDDFSQFKLNFKARLKRLNTIYSNHDDNRKELLVQINLIADEKNWDGAFAELATFDYLNQDILKDGNYLSESITLNHTISKEKTFSEQLGKNESNLDGFYIDYDIYFDVKCFKDNVREILQGIYKQVKQKLNNHNFKITAEHPRDIAYDDFKSLRQDIINELSTKIKPSEKTKYVECECINNLKFKLIWEEGMLSTTSTYSPYKHAENYHKTIFNYANKLMKNNPSFIVLVVFPWFNLVINSFDNGNYKMFKSFARRVFCQYKHNNKKFNLFNSKFNGNETIYDISKKISGIIFLEDNTILSKQPNETNVKSYIFFNPNADNKIKNSFAEDMLLLGLDNVVWDDFEHDNY